MLNALVFTFWVSCTRTRILIVQALQQEILQKACYLVSPLRRTLFEKHCFFPGMCWFFASGTARMRSVCKWQRTVRYQPVGVFCLELSSNWFCLALLFLCSKADVCYCCSLICTSWEKSSLSNSFRSAAKWICPVSHWEPLRLGLYYLNKLACCHSSS